MSACRKCGNPIKFVSNTETGRRIPVDPVPDEGGNVIAEPIRTTQGEPTKDLRGRPRRGVEPIPDGWSLFMPHFATCRARIPKGRGNRRPLTLFDDPPQTTESAGSRGTEGTP